MKPWENLRLEAKTYWKQNLVQSQKYLETLCKSVDILEVIM